MNMWFRPTRLQVPTDTIASPDRHDRRSRPTRSQVSTDTIAGPDRHDRRSRPTRSQVCDLWPDHVERGVDPAEGRGDVYATDHAFDGIANVSSNGDAFVTR